MVALPLTERVLVALYQFALRLKFFDLIESIIVQVSLLCLIAIPKHFGEPDGVAIVVEILKSFFRSFRDLAWAIFGSPLSCYKTEEYVCSAYTLTISRAIDKISALVSDVSKKCNQQQFQLSANGYLHVAVAVGLFCLWRIGRPYVYDALSAIPKMIASFRAPYCPCCGEKHWLWVCPNGGYELQSRASQHGVDIMRPSCQQGLHVVEPYQGVATFDEARRLDLVPKLEDTYVEIPAPSWFARQPVSRGSQLEQEFYGRFNNVVRAQNPGATYARQKQAYTGLQDEVMVVLNTRSECPDPELVGNSAHRALYKVQTASGECLGGLNHAASNFHLDIRRWTDEQIEFLEPNGEGKRAVRASTRIKNKRARKK